VTLIGFDAVTMGLLKGSVKIVGPVSKALREYYRDVKAAEGVKDALSIGPKQLHVTGYRHRSLHPYMPGAQFHPDNLAGLAAVLHEDVSKARARNAVTETSSCPFRGGV
jgi:hypothetical protein